MSISEIEFRKLQRDIAQLKNDMNKLKKSVLTKDSYNEWQAATFKDFLDSGKFTAQFQESMNVIMQMENV